MLLHNDAGGTATAVEHVKKRFPGEIVALRTALDDPETNFEHPAAQGARSCVAQMQIDHPDLDPQTLVADGIIAVGEFCQALRHHCRLTAHQRRSVSTSSKRRPWSTITRAEADLATKADLRVESVAAGNRLTLVVIGVAAPLFAPLAPLRYLPPPN